MEVSRICSDLVKIRSENPPGETAEVIGYIREFLDRIGIRSQVYEPSRGSCSLVAGNPRSAELLFCGHVDVVPARSEGWTHPPFSGLIEDGFVWGRGSTDMKGGCAAVLAACESFIGDGRDLPASLAFVCDEETGGELGIRHILAQDALTPCDCVVAEPTPLRHPSIGQKGLLRLEMSFSGDPAHGSLYPVVGTSAIVEAMNLVGYLKTESAKDIPFSPGMQEVIEASSHVISQEFHIEGIRDVLTRVTFNPGVIAGGEKSNVVAQHCDLDLEMRIPWGCSIGDLVAGIRAHSPRGTIRSQEAHEPSLTSPDSRIVSVACEEIQKVHGGEVFPFVQWAASDARHLRKKGFAVIEYGPGEISTLHAVNERVSADTLEKAVRIYRGILERYTPDKKR